MSCPFPFREKAATAHFWYHGFGGSFKGSARSPPKSMQGWKTGTWQSHTLRAEWNNNIKAQPPCSGGFRVECVLLLLALETDAIRESQMSARAARWRHFWKEQEQKHTHAQVLILPWWQGTYTEKPTSRMHKEQKTTQYGCKSHSRPLLSHTYLHTHTHTSSTSCLVSIICPPVDLSVRWLNISSNMQMLFFIRGCSLVQRSTTEWVQYYGSARPTSTFDTSTRTGLHQRSVRNVQKTGALLSRFKLQTHILATKIYSAVKVLPWIAWIKR